jgi:hypothetical protein
MWQRSYSFHESLEYLFFRRVVSDGLNLLSESPRGPMNWVLPCRVPHSCSTQTPSGCGNSLKCYSKPTLPTATYYGQPGNYQRCAYKILVLYLKRH